MEQVSQNKNLGISHFSDVLCVWAYVAQIRIDELQAQFSDQLVFDYRFMPLFADTQSRIGEGWAQRGGFDGFATHVQEVAQEFPHVTMHSDVWTACRPRSSSQAHWFIKAVQLLEQQGEVSTEVRSRTQFEQLVWNIRSAFFEHAQDVSQHSVLMGIAESMQLPLGSIEALLNNGEAMAALFADISLRDTHKVEGSPTFVLNDGRQKLYGNVGYKIIEANVLELLSAPAARASWC